MNGSTFDSYSILSNKKQIYPTEENFRRMISDQTFQEGQGSCAIFACAASWLKNNDKLIYSVDHAYPNSFKVENGQVVPISSQTPDNMVDGKNPLVCEAFVEMCLRGIGFEESAWGDGTNTVKYPSWSVDWTSWDFCKYACGGYENRPEKVPVIDYNMSDYEGKGYREVSTWKFARFLRDHGLYTRFDPKVPSRHKHQCLRTGDIVFFGNPEADADTANNSTQHYDLRFDGIRHTGIFICWDRNRENYCKILDCNSTNSADYPVQIRFAHDDIDDFRIVGYARIPLGNNNSLSYESDLDLSVYLGDYKNSEVESHPVYLKNQISLFDIYRFTFAFKYTDDTDIYKTFPCIYWMADGSNIGIVCNRLNEYSQVATQKEVWYTADLVVTMDRIDVKYQERNLTDKTNRFRIGQYNLSEETVSGKLYVQNLKVTPVCLNCSDHMMYNNKMILRDRYEFESFSEIVQYLLDYHTSILTAGTNLAILFKNIKVETLEYGVSGSLGIMAKIIKIRSTKMIIAAWNVVGAGAILNMNHVDGTPASSTIEIITYPTNEFPYQYWM